MESVAECYGSGEELCAGLLGIWVYRGVWFGDIQGYGVVVDHTLARTCSVQVCLGLGLESVEGKAREIVVLVLGTLVSVCLSWSHLLLELFIIHTPYTCMLPRDTS